MGTLLLVNETNRYAEGRTDGVNMKPFSHMRRWTVVTISEMKIFISLVIAMGLTRKPDLESYWSTDPTISTPFFGSKMAKDRFMAILSNLHLVDNDNHPTGRLYKLNPFIRMMRRIFDVYSPEEMLSFNEGTCPIKGRVKFRAYNPKSHTNLD